MAHLANGSAVELNLEGNPFAEPQPSARSGVSDYPGFMALVERVRPAQVTLVPDSDDQLTSDHGFDIDKEGERLRPIVQQLKDWGCRVSLFMDPVPEQIALIPSLGADRIELYTETYAEAHSEVSMPRCWLLFRAPPESPPSTSLVSMPGMIST